MAGKKNININVKNPECFSSDSNSYQRIHIVEIVEYGEKANKTYRLHFAHLWEIGEFIKELKILLQREQQWLDEILDEISEI